MSKVITFSQRFPSYHSKAGHPTGFVKSILKHQKIAIDKNYFRMLMLLNTKSLDRLTYKDVKSFFENLQKEDEPAYIKKHTIRAGKRWKVGDKFSPRVWCGKPYRSPQIIFAPYMEIKKIWDFKIRTSRDQSYFLLNDIKIRPYDTQDEIILLNDIANNDGLDFVYFLDWFKYPNDFSGQIICWDENVNY